ncbi:MAG: TonB-dependent receptor [Bacteroidota bacterium]|nr:TonB-dependent receptor [Bacteroidota bacterium]
MNKTFIASLFLLAGTLSVQAEPFHLNDSSYVHDLDEVLVVSQPKEQYRLRLQPISSSMFSGDNINSLNVRDLRELSVYVPNFNMPNYGSRYTSAIYVRGTGSRINSPAVGIYIDGMPVMSKSAFNTHIYDLSRIDILRGPQATLYGLNSEAGLVRLYTKNPMNYQGTDIHIGGGSYFYRNAELSHYKKVNDWFAFSVAGFYEGQNGFFKNEFLNEDADKYNEGGGRLKLMFRPTKQWTADITADYQYTRQNGFPYGQIGEDGLAQDPATNVMNNYKRHLFTTALNVGYHGNGYDFTSTSSYQYLKDFMAMDIDYTPKDFMQMEEKQLQNAFTQEFAFKSKRPVGDFWHWTVGAFGGFSWLKTNSLVDFGKEMDSFLGNTVQKSMYDAMLNAMAGRFIGMGMTPDAASAAAGAMIEQAGGVNMMMDMREVPGVYRTPIYNIGFFHESSFDITERLSAMLGLRYDWSHVSIDYSTSASIFSAANVMGRTAEVTVSSLLKNQSTNDFDQLLPKFGFTYRVSDNGSNVYATLSKGYRAGGYNIQMFSDILQAELQANSSQRADYSIPHSTDDYARINKTIAYKPETSWNYEVGTHLNLFNNQLQFDLSAFYMQIRNQQISKMAGNYGFGRMMTNAGKSMSCGLEASLRGQAVNNHLAWTLNYGLTHAQFEEYSDTITASGKQTVINYKNNKVPFVPINTMAASVDYRFDMETGNFIKSITIGTNIHAQGKTYWDEANSLSQNIYAVLGAHIGVELGHASVNLWGRNLTNARYNVFAVNSGASGQTNWFAQRGNPFQIGADLRLHF